MIHTDILIPDPDWIDARNIFTGCFIIIYVYDSCEDVSYIDEKHIQSNTYTYLLTLNKFINCF